MATEPPPGILGGLMATVDAGRKVGHGEISLLDDLLHVAAGMAWNLGLPPERVAARLVLIMAAFGRPGVKGGSDAE